METPPFEAGELIKAASRRYRGAALHRRRPTRAFVTPKFKYELFRLMFLAFCIFFTEAGGGVRGGGGSKKPAV